MRGRAVVYLPWATEIAVHVEIPEAEDHRLADQQDVIHRSLLALAHLAATPSQPPTPGGASHAPAS